MLVVTLDASETMNDSVIAPMQGGLREGILDFFAAPADSRSPLSPGIRRCDPAQLQGLIGANNRPTNNPEMEFDRRRIHDDALAVDPDPVCGISIPFPHEHSSPILVE